jgi:hypothetical protein
MRINSAQNVGIGETSTMVADYKLQVRNDNNGESNPLLISNRDTSVSTAQNVTLNFGLSRDSGAFKPQAGRIRVGREGNTWDADDANIDSYMDFSVYQSNALSTKLTIASDGLATFAGDIATPGIQMGSGVANDIQADGKTAYIGSAIFGDSAASNTPLAPVHIKGTGAPALRIEDLDNSNQVYDFISNEGVGLSRVDQTASITPLAFAHTTGNATFAADVIVTGDLFVTGASTAVNVEDLNVEQGEITLNYGTGDTSAAANGAGIRIQDAVDASTDATILWNATNDNFEFSHGIDVNDAGVTDNAWNTLAKFRPDLSDASAETSIHIQSYPSTTVVADRKAGIQAIDDLGVVRPLLLNKDGGNVGIGATPNTKLHVSSAVTTKSVVETTGTSSDALIEFTKGQGSGNTWSMGLDHSNSSAFSLAYLSNGSPSLTTHGLVTVDTSGNVGIGTTSPDSKLDVEADEDTWLARIYNTGSDANAQGLLVRSDATAAHDAPVMGVYADGGYKMLVKSTGNVGIGTTNPSTALDVAGDVTIGSARVSLPDHYQRLLRKQRDLR